MKESLVRMLAQEDDFSKEQAIYSISRILIVVKLHYSSTKKEKEYLSFIFVTKKLCHYLLDNIIFFIVHYDPIRYLLTKINFTRPLGK